MQVFKTYFLLLKKYKWTILLYFTVFIAVALVMTGVLSQDGESEFTAAKLTVAVLDEDGETFGDALKDYFGESHHFVEMEYDKKAILNELYWKKLDYVLVIPKGFEQSLLTEETPSVTLKNMKVPGFFDATYFEAELSLYLTKLTGLLKAGCSLTEAEQRLSGIKGEQAKVQMASFVNKNQNDASTTFFVYVPYLFITVGIVGVGIVVLRLNGQEVKDRTECSSTPLWERTLGMAMGILLFGLFLYLSVIVAAALLSKGSILTDNRMPFFGLNIFAMLLFGLSLGFLTGTVAKNQDTVNGMVNVISLILCFMGGVFVPQEFFGEGVLKVARFMPTYWYVRTNEDIGAMVQMTPSLLKQVMAQTGLVVCYAVAIFAVTLVVISARRKRAA